MYSFIYTLGNFFILRNNFVFSAFGMHSRYERDFFVILDHYNENIDHKCSEKSKNELTVLRRDRKCQSLISPTDNRSSDSTWNPSFGLSAISEGGRTGGLPKNTRKKRISAAYSSALRDKKGFNFRWERQSRAGRPQTNITTARRASRRRPRLYLLLSSLVSI